MDISSFYTFNGPVLPNRSGVYVARRADEQVLQACRNRELVYVYGPRQIGKTSLAARAAALLSETKVSAAYVDLTALGTDASADEWYLRLARYVAHRLSIIDTEGFRWLKSRSELTAAQRLQYFFERELPEEVEGQIVILLDELEAAPDPNFFLSFIRSLYNINTNEVSPGLRRVSFVLIGATPPHYLPSDPSTSTSPFINRATTIELTDFTSAEALPLADGFDLDGTHARQLLERVLEWTGGHPYLTQRLCAAVAENNRPSYSEKLVDDVVAEIFLTDKGARDPHLMYIKQTLANLVNAVMLGDIVAGRFSEIEEQIRVDGEQARAFAELLISGVVLEQEGKARIRNRIYAEVFSPDWHNEERWLDEERWRSLRAELETEFLEGTLSKESLGLFLDKSGARVSRTVEDLTGSPPFAEQEMWQVIERSMNRLVTLGVLRRNVKRSLFRRPQVSYELSGDTIAARVREWLAEKEPDTVTEVKTEHKYWFYFSYAREELGDDLRRLFQSLSELVRQATGESGVVGFIDKEWVEAGGQWSEAIAEAIVSSRAFVAIYTPNYFRSELCGKEWRLFESRLEAAMLQAMSEAGRTGASPPPLILPVLWSFPEELPQPLPQAAANIQYRWPELGEAYARNGLRQLMKTPGNDREYGDIVISIAKQIVERGKTFRLPPIHPPSLETVESSFTPASEPDEKAKEIRYVLVAGTGRFQLPDAVLNVSREVGKALARNGYGLVVGGWEGVDYVTSEAYASELSGTGKSLTDYLIQVVPESTTPQFSGGRVINVQEGPAEYSEEVKFAEAAILIGGLGGTYEVYKYAKRVGKPVFPVAGTGRDARRAFEEIVAAWDTNPLAGVNAEMFHALERGVETEDDVRKVTDTLIELLDDLRREPHAPLNREEALSLVHFVRGNLLEQPVDAIVNSVGMDARRGGLIGYELLKIFGSDFYSDPSFQKSLAPGEIIVSKVGERLSASYIIHVCSEAGRDSHTLDSIGLAAAGALREADSLKVHSIAFPSIGTGAAGMRVSDAAPKILETVVSYIEQGSGLERVVFAFNDEETYRAYLDAYMKMGGVGLNVLLPRLSASSRNALRFAEALRQEVKHNWINTRLLLWGLYQKRDGAARELLTAVADSAEIEKALSDWVGVESLPTDIQPADEAALARVSLSPHCQQALVNALELAGEAVVVRERQVLGGLLAVESRATRWIEDVTGLGREELREIVAVRDEDEGSPILPQVRSLLARRSQVLTRPWRLRLSETDNAAELRVGERRKYRLELLPVLPTDEEEEAVLRVPANTLELTGYIKAYGFHLHGDSIFTIPVAEGRPATQGFTFELTPLVSGQRTIQVELYPGGRVQGLRPSTVSLSQRVASPVELPNIEELIDRRRIPNPQPDVMLYVALEELPAGARTRIYLTCPALNLDREQLEPLALTARDHAELRRMAINTAAAARHLSHRDVLAAMRGFGAMLFDRIMPESLQSYYPALSQLAAESAAPWSWLIVSDENVLLPWELLCYYYVDEGRIRYDDFLADRFVVSHWVGRRGLRLVREAPVGKLDLIHYAQRREELGLWLRALGGEEFAQAEEESGHLSLLQPGSYFYGLHLLRYTEQQRSDRIVAAAPDGDGEKASARSEGEDITYEQRLDLTLRRPTVGLSFVETEPPGSPAHFRQRDTRVESNWMIPLMHAGASALVGTRWPVSEEADRLFVEQFYRAMRGGEALGAAVWIAREQVRASFPHSADWLAYTYFGHPQCEPYTVRPSQGFTLFEAIDQPDDLSFAAGGTYHFRASYRREAPAWYDGRLRAQEGPLEADDISIVVMPLSGVVPETHALRQVPQSDDLQCIVELKMPEKKTTLPVLVRFQKGSEELRTITLNLQVEETVV